MSLPRLNSRIGWVEGRGYRVAAAAVPFCVAGDGMISVRLGKDERRCFDPDESEPEEEDEDERKDI